MPDTHEVRPVFVGGSGRSGSTALKNALAKHPEVGAYDELEIRIVVAPGGVLDLLTTMCSSWDPHAGDHALNMLSRAWSYVEKKFPNAEKVTPAVKNLIGKLTIATVQGGPRDRVWETPFRETKPLSLQQAQTLLLEFFGDLYRHPSWTHGIDDTPYGPLRTRQIRKIVPSTPVIAIVRAPKDTLASMISRKWAPKRWDDCALRLKHVLGRLSDLADDSQLSIMRLEDLTEDPVGRLGQACELLGLEWNDAMLDHGISSDDAHIGRGAQLPPEGLVAYKAHLAEVAERLGYE
jgi:hypothetical protein